MVPIGQVQQKHGKALLGAHAAKEKHHVLDPGNLAGHDMLEDVRHGYRPYTDRWGKQ